MFAWIRQYLLAGAGFFLVLLWALSAVAQEGPEIDVPPPDLGFGEFELAEEARFSEPQRVRGRVDQRAQLNPMAGRGIGWSTGFIAPRGAVTFSQDALLGQRLAVSVYDGFQLSGYYFLPLANQTYAGAGGQVRLVSGDAWALTGGLKGRYRRTNFEPGTTDAGLGLHVVLDVIAADDTTWNVGASAKIPLYLAVEEVDHADCNSRREWAEGACGTTARRNEFMPLSGHWVALYAGVNHFLTDWMVLNVEGFTGVSQANFWALESALDREVNYSTELQLVEETDWSSGLGPLGILTLGVGATFRAGRFGIQPSMYMTNYEGEATIFPYLSMALSVGTGR